MNRNFEQRFRRKNQFNDNQNNNNRNFNNNNNNNNNPNNNRNFGNNNVGSSNFNSNQNNQNNSLHSRLGNVQPNTRRFQPAWKSRDVRNSRRPPHNSGRPNQPTNNRGRSNRYYEGQQNPDRWFKITVPMASKLEPFFVVNAIQQQGIEFVPFNYSVYGNSVIFYVQGDELCYSIKSLSRRITTPEGLKLIFQTEKSPIPIIDITPEFTDKLKVVMSKRYDANSKSLQLSQFSSEEDFLSMRLFVSLQRINVCKQVVSIIIENIPDLVSLNLSNNKIQNLEVFKPLATSCRNLKQLDLSHNNINNIDHIDNLKGLDLDTLNMDFNPFKKNIKDKSQENYVRLVRIRFPKVINLDGISIPPPICFDVDEEPTTLPESKTSSIPDHLKDFVENFVKKYFELFDSDNRQQLLDTYYEQADFSFTINRMDSRPKQKAFEMNLLNESRNLLRINGNQREKLLKRGRAYVVTALSNLPATEHILQSFKIDVPIYADNYIVINISGLFKTKRPYNLKSFTRNFLIVSHNSFAIVNDMLSITNPSVENINFVKNLYKNDPNSQEINFMDSMDEMGVNESSSLGMNQINSIDQIKVMNNQAILNPTGQSSIDFMNPSTINNNQINLLNNNLVSSTPSPVNQTSINNMNPIASSSVNPNHEELISRFSQVTGMNRDFSQKCLLENNYNADAALEIFKTLNEKNMIPAEAFKR